MKLTTYLFFDGQCESAFKFYEQCLGGRIDELMRYAGSPAQDEVPPERRNDVLHVSLIANDHQLMGSDAPSGHFEKPRGFAVALHVADPPEAERVFKVLAKDGTITMPMEKTFWSVRFGMLVDKFGIPWMVNCDQAAT